MDMARNVSRLIRQIVLASLPVLGAGSATACSSGDGSADGLDGGGDTANCGMCGCGYNGSHTQIVPYKPECDTGAPPSDTTSDDAGDADDADGAGDADASTTDATRDTATVDGCGDPPSAVVNCSIQCPSGAPPMYGFPSSCRLLPAEAGAAPMVECTYVQPCGRRPAHLARATDADFGAGDDAIARHLAEAAFLEAASVDAFEILAAELAQHAAPPSLVRRARRAARDEVRHAQVMRRLSSRRGVTPATPRAVKAKNRPLEAIALENAIEGCVRETYGAAMAAWQGEMAEDRATRCAMRAIARDEAKHADLAWSVAQWASGRLGAKARARVDRARSRAIATLRAELEAPVDRELVRCLGVPDRAAALAMLARLERTLW
jgi:hypothetical protein